MLVTHMFATNRYLLTAFKSTSQGYGSANCTATEDRRSEPLFMFCDFPRRLSVVGPSQPDMLLYLIASSQSPPLRESIQPGVW